MQKTGKKTSKTSKNWLGWTVSLAPSRGQAFYPSAKHRFGEQCADFHVCVSAGQKCYCYSVSALRRCSGAARPACMAWNSSVSKIRVSLKALALHCSAGWPTSSGNGFALALNTAVAVLVPCIHHHGLFLKQQQQCSSSSGCCSGLGSAGEGCWMLEVLEAAVL